LPSSTQSSQTLALPDQGREGGNQQMRILLGVTGGIAAYKALEFARLAVKAGHSVRVVQTPASLRFVGRSSFAAITGAPVLVSEFENDPSRGAWPGEAVGDHQPISHLAVVERADVVVVAPATANSLARLAAGAGDDMVTTSVLAADCPVLIAPAMNGKMWDNPATLANVEVLRSRGLTVLDPVEGQLASHGEQGKGRLVEPPALLAHVERSFSAAAGDGVWHGVKVLITAGGTREPIDDVRFIGNRSSGRMGVALAEAAIARGAEVTLLIANTQVAVPQGCSVMSVTTASELGDLLELEAPKCDVLLMAAAVADFRPVRVGAGKIDKTEGIPRIELEAVPDLITKVAAKRSDRQLFVGFAAEHGGGTERARGKLERKSLDAIVFNDISDSSIGFDSPDNAVTVLTRDGDTVVSKATKRQIADAILDVCSALRA